MKFQKMVRELRKKLPPLLPVRVYRRPMVSGFLGETVLVYKDDGKPCHFRIAVHTPLAWQAAWQILIHEWAHAIAWREGHESVQDHDPEWALALSRVYQVTMEPEELT
jgi:hypothetical protein